jgi:membrane protease YdiL (CAAX protease family)
LFIGLGKKGFFRDYFAALAEGYINVNEFSGLMISAMHSQTMILVMFFSCAITIGGVVFFCKSIKKRSYASMGIVKSNAVKGYMAGVLYGFAILLLSYVILYVGGYVAGVSYNGFDNFIIWFFFGFIIQSASEELLFRGYFMNSLAAASNAPLAVTLNSAFFAAFHLMNPGVTVLSTVNTFVLGLIFSLLFLLTESIWVVSGVHFIWNFISGCIVGSNVSGMEIKSLFSIPLTGSEFFAGGEYGIEGSIVVTITGVFAIVLTIIAIVLQRKRRKSVLAR